MATYTGVADANGDFSVPFSFNYTSGEKITVIAEKNSAVKSIELYAPSEVVGGGIIQFSGTLDNFPQNIGVITVSGITTINSFGLYAADNANTTLFKRATGLVLSDGLVSIGQSALGGWGFAKSLSLPNTLQTIGNSAFSGWVGLTSIVIPDSVKYILSYAFYSNNSVLNVTLGSALLSIGEYGLKDLFNCNQITCFATTPPEIQATTFANLKSTCIFKVPAASVAAYKAAANWSAFASRIQAI